MEGHQTKLYLVFQLFTF